MIFLNISSDFVQLFSDWRIQNLERNTIENTLWKALLEEKNKSNFKSIFLLNGPGWFTNLRVGTLCLNTLDSLFPNQIQIYDTSKISLYKFLYDHKFLPRIWYIYIWQKNNCRKYDLQTEKYETITKAEIQYEWNYFLDFVYENWYRQDAENMVKFNLIGEDIQINFLDKNKSVSIEDLSLKPQYQVAPDYMIDAVKPF